MRLYDTHCHFETASPVEIAAILSRARAAGVEAVMAVGGSPALNAAAELAAEVAASGEGMPRVCFATGFDRDQVNSPGHPQPQKHPSVSLCLCVNPEHPQRAIGEIGLDYHYSPETREAQRELFGAQLEEAAKRNLPVIIHTREADDDTLALLREVPSRGVIHCYTGTPEAAKAFLDLGFYISFSGIVTFRLADNVRAAAAVVPDDRILIETDSPFLAPVPLRGKVNEPAFVRHTCEYLAARRGMAADDFAALTFANAEMAFA